MSAAMLGSLSSCVLLLAPVPIRALNIPGVRVGCSVVAFAEVIEALTIAVPDAAESIEAIDVSI
jgi:hypothetical protein